MKPRVTVFSDDAPPVLEKPEKGVLYLWFDKSGRVHVFQHGMWFISPYFV